MSLIDGFDIADEADSQPGQVYAARVEHDGGCFSRGSLVTIIVIGPQHVPELDRLYLLDNGREVAVVRMLRSRAKC